MQAITNTLDIIDISTFSFLFLGTNDTKDVRDKCQTT